MEQWLCGWAEIMARTPQDPLWHGEGDVLTHTRLVCRALEALPEYQQKDPATRKLLLLAALFHDVGKPGMTRREDGHIVSPGHGRLGAQIARQVLWQEHGLCGSQEATGLREAVCGLIRRHSMPPHAMADADGQRKLLAFAADGALVPGLTVENLCILSKADILGRINPEQEEKLEQVALCRELALEAGCLDGPYPFPNARTRRSYLAGRAVSPEHPVYDDSWGQVILMSGLPGTGKDTWIQENCPELPMISLDEIRRELGISPAENQSRVVELGRERARQLLRKKQPFVWNATNLSPQVRQKQVSLFADYGASTRIVYLETSWQEQCRRNAGRPDAVPEGALCRMLETLTPPQATEADAVQWLWV